MGKPNRSKENVQLEPPALLGRRQRIADFRQFIEANRKDMTVDRLVAVCSIETGISLRTLYNYLKVFYQAGLYRRPNIRITDSKLVTSEEYDVLLKEYEKREAEERKKLEAARESIPYGNY